MQSFRVTANSSKNLLFIFLGFAFLIFKLFPSLPSYTKLASVFFLLPTIFFLLRKEEKLEEKRLFPVLALSIIAMLLWDTIAIKIGMWGFPRESVSYWILGIPIEEYIFGIFFSTAVLGIYTSLPKFRDYVRNSVHLLEIPLLLILFVLQLVTWLFLFFSNPVSYIKWLLFFTIIPSIFYLWRKGEKIDEVRLILTIIIMAVATVVIDLIFLPAGTWYYNESALLGRVGAIPIEDILFSVFAPITIIGIYTSLPPKHIFARW